ncbi:MAG TPA: hypothetical protein VNX21_00045 [Candidatus Thermoplasmatota archaeon]|nr:hypothetical protein [Candidatus Thermoplasmatota archaeon]
MTRALALAALLLLPVAAADHVFSHRVVVEGRLIGGDGLPLPGVEVEVSAVGETLAEPCQERQRNVTDAWGDFRLCFHKHDLAPGAWVTVVAGNASKSLPLDADLRRMVVYLRDAQAEGVAPEAWEETYHLDGRLWERGRTRLDGVNVSGVTLVRVPVDFLIVNETRAEGDEEKGARSTLRTDGFGDYAAIVRLFPGERVEDASVTVEANGARAQARLDPAFHRSTIDFRFPIEPEGAPVAPPGTTTPPVSVPLLVGVGLALWAALALQRKK